MRQRLLLACKFSLAARQLFKNLLRLTDFGRNLETKEVILREYWGLRIDNTLQTSWVDKNHWRKDPSFL
jgi:hypothetical protein